jgi:hypothetical protein
MKTQLLTMEKVSQSPIDYEFFSTVVARFFKVLFRSDKRIKMIYMNYSNNHSLGNDILMLNYRFKNAIFYKVNGQTTEKYQIVLHKIDIESILDIKVYGLFSQKSFKFNVSNE